MNTQKRMCWLCTLQLWTSKLKRNPFLLIGSSLSYGLDTMNSWIERFLRVLQELQGQTINDWKQILMEMESWKAVEILWKRSTSWCRGKPRCHQFEFSGRQGAHFREIALQLASVRHELNNLIAGSVLVTRFGCHGLRYRITILHACCVDTVCPKYKLLTLHGTAPETRYSHLSNLDGCFRVNEAQKHRQKKRRTCMTDREPGWPEELLKR